MLLELAGGVYHAIAACVSRARGQEPAPRRHYCNSAAATGYGPAPPANDREE